METLWFWIAVAISGFGLSVVAGRWVVQHAAMLAYGLNVPPFLIGVTVIALGTDVPEIANSVMASLAGHGDLNVGDSIGSVVTQITLILGLLPFFGGRMELGASRSVLVSALTIVALNIGAWMVVDGYLSRGDALLLLLVWVIATVVIWRYAPSFSEPEFVAPTHHKGVHALIVLAGLLLVGVGAGAAVKAMVELSAAAGVPEYLISFFGSSIGTSLPELVVTITAIRSGQRDLALGDIVGACLLDSTVSVAAGPLFAPTAVTAALAVRGATIAMSALFLVELIIGSRQRHDRWSGGALLLLYGAVYLVIT